MPSANDFIGRHNAVYPEVLLDNFYTHLLPLRSCLEQSNAVEKVIERLQNAPKPLLEHDPDSGELFFRAISSKKASKTPGEASFITLEDIARRIEGIVDDLVTEIGEKLEPLVQYQEAPAAAPASFNGTSATHILGGHFIRCNRQEEGAADYWIDIGVAGELNWGQSSEAHNKVARQTVQDMHYILQEDERRRFTLAFTVTEDAMRLWYANRSDIFVSEPFDIISSPEHLVRFFLAVTYAHEYRLGWDPTMKYVAATETEARHLLIAGRLADAPHSTMIFKTVDVLSNVGAQTIRGRGTRVWRVEAVMKDGKPLVCPQTYVLKDSWTASDLEREGSILQKVRESAKTLCDEGKKRLLDALLTVVTYGDVWIDPQDGPDVEEGFYDSTFTTEQRALIHPPGSEYVRVRGSAMGDVIDERQARANSYALLEQAKRDYEYVAHDPKTHSRIVFAEICKPIRDERQLHKVYLALSNTSSALQALHNAGWVHGDISSTNVLLWHDQVKIGDFEYARPFERMMSADELEKSPHRTRAGTPAFISIEVLDGFFAFTDDTRPSSSVRSVGKPTAKHGLGRAYYVPPLPNAIPKYVPPSTETDATGESTVAENPVPWQQYPLHDLESLFWLSDQLTLNRDLYFVLAGYPEVEVHAPEAGETVRARSDRLTRQGAAARTLRYNHPQRHMNLLYSPIFSRNLATLHPFLQRRNSDPSSCSVSDALTKFRTCLVQRYREAERDPATITKSVGEDLYYTVAEAFDYAASSLRMFNHVACTRPLIPELYKLIMQNPLIKDLSEPAPLTTQTTSSTSTASTASTVEKRSLSPNPSSDSVAEFSDDEDFAEDSPMRKKRRIQGP